MKSKPVRKKKVIFITVIVLVLAAAAAATAAYYFTHREDPVTVKSVDLKDNYQIIKETIEVGDLKATYFNERENKEWIEKIPDYTVFIDEKAAENKDGNVHVSVKNGDYTVTVKWEDQEGKPREYSQKVTLTNYYPMFVETGAQFTKDFGPYPFPWDTTGKDTYKTKIDIQLPEVQSSTPDYEACNEIIKKHCRPGFEMAKNFNKGITEIEGHYNVSDYAEYTYKYNIYICKDTTALIVTYEGGMPASGGWSLYTGVYYDNKTGKCLTEVQYAKANGYKPEEILRLYQAEQFSIEAVKSINDFNAYDSAFYFDKNGKPQMEISVSM